MSRNGSGTYTLPSGNPVVSGTLIEATWANSTLSDIASALTDSLSRSGQGGMTAAFRAFDGTSSVPGIAWGSETTTGWYRAGAGDMRLVVTGSEVIRYQAAGVAITGTLGVGTTSLGSGTRLEVRAANTITDGRGVIAVNTTNAAAANVGGSISLGGETGQATTPYVFGSVAGRYEGSGYSGYLQFSTTSSGGVVTERARIDSAGNLGLGVTPSAWASGYVSFENKSGALYAPNTSQVTLIQNAYYNGSNFIYRYSSQNASRYQQNNGEHTWHVSGSGTAGNAISFTQAMTLDASGRLAIGTTSPIAFSNQTSVTVNGTNNGRFDIKVGDTHTAAFVGGSSAVEVAAITNVPIVFATNGSERARIDSSGNLLVGTTSQSPTFGKVRVYANGIAGLTTERETTSSVKQVVFYNPNGEVGAIYTSGSSTSYATSSDYRLKENVQPMTGALAKVAALKPCTYKWKADGSDGEGFIAHELAEVVPQAVTGEKDATSIEQYEITPAVYEDVVIPAVTDEDGNITQPERTERRLVSEAVMGEREVPAYQGIDTSFLVATLTAAIQELKADLDATKAELAALKTT